MKIIIKRYVYSYAILNVLVWIIARSISINQEADLNLRALIWGPVLISLLISLSVFVFQLKMKNPLFNVVLGYLVLFPAAIILRVMYRPYIFNRVIALYIIGFIIALIYGFIIFYASLRNTKDAKALNALLSRPTEDKEKIDE